MSAVRRPWDDGLNVEVDPSLLGDPERGRHFLRSHFPVPTLDLGSYELRIEGAVERPLHLRFDDLAAMPQVERTVAMECAGNGRGLAADRVDGVQWIGGAVGRASWRGVPLADLLAMAGPLPGARRVLLGGADAGAVHGLEDVRFERGLPLATATDGGVLVALAMDGRPIPPEHGGPARGVVPGWYGVASVKWLTSVTVLTEDRYTYWETADYSVPSPVDPGGTMPLTTMLPKAQIVSPARDAVLEPGTVIVTGLAWAGARRVATVELSTDGGRSWSPATLDGVPAPHDWVGWHATWQATDGTHRLAVRCTDEDGRTQPLERDPDRGRYLFNEVVVHPVTVGALVEETSR